MKTFNEIQHTQKPLFIALPILMWAAFTIYSIIELYNYIYHGIPLGNNDSDLPIGFFIIVMISMNLAFGFLLFIIVKMRLIININEVSIYFEMPPFKKPTEYKFDEIEYLYVRKYYPVYQYGGWGWRGIKNKAYNISGRWGIQIVLKNKKQILLGIKKHEEAAQYLESIGFNKKP